MRQLTNDRYADLQPDWSPDGRTLAFVSDRGAGADLDRSDYAPLGIWLLDVASGQARPARALRRPAGAGRTEVNPQFGAERARPLLPLRPRRGQRPLPAGRWRAASSSG